MCDKKNKVLFTDTECLVLSPDFKLPDENQVLLRVPRQHNMYSFNLENFVPFEGLTCLIVKATIDESNKWHRRLGHVNFKNLNKLVRKFVRGLPSKIFQNDHTCVACQKGKHHKASCKAKVVSSISQLLQLLHMDLFGPTSVRSINHKTYYLVITDDFSRCDNGTEFKNREMIEFYRSKGFKREYTYKWQRIEANKNAGPDRKLNHSAGCWFKKNEEPEEQVDQVFLEELKRLKRQEKDANDAAEALRMNFAEPRVSTDAPHPDQDDSQIPTLEDMYDSPSSRIFTKASYDDEGAVADFINLESIVNVSPIPTSRIHHYPTTSNIPPLLGDPT
ncbi:putative ribonuclease H-like domain-containing protein [Tanacetum coccineum]